MGQALHISGGLVSQIGANALGVNILDANSGGAISIGSTAATTAVNVGTNANNASVTLGGAATTSVGIGTGAANKTINIGSAGDTINIGDEAPGVQTVTLNVKANMTVQGTEHVVGGTTFDADVTLGDAGTDVITVNGVMGWSGLGTISSDLPFTHASHSINIANGATTATLTLKAANNSAGAGGNINITPGTGSLTTNTGSIVFGPTTVADDAAYQILANSGAAGIRYAAVADKWQVHKTGGLWLDLATGNSIPNGTATGDILQWDGVSAWVNRTFTTLNNGAAIDIGHSAGDTQYAMSLHGQDGIAGAGGNTTVRGGAGAGATAGGSMNVRGGATATGTAGALNLTGGTASSTGTGGAVNINGGSHTGGAHGNILLAQDGAGIVYFGAGANGLSFTASTGVLVAIGSGAINLDTVGSRLQIKGSAVTDNAGITAGNFLKLFDGSSDVTSHTHAASASTTTDVPVAVDGAAVNDVVYIAAADTITIAQANGATAARAAGVRTAANTVRIAGIATVQIEGTLIVAAGDDLYLSTTSAGDVTNAVPGSGFITYVGQAKTGGTGPATISMYVRCERPIAL